ncbi:MAG TPA: hypothetical protein VNE16_16395 [Vicinamibacterales bacterium]|nr:hypothetical protein [Vicinamibacterales bacterium]
MVYDLDASHRLSSRHRAAVEAAPVVGCFFCCRLYPPARIDRWCDGGATAICPVCGIGAVVPAAIGGPLTPGLLREMYVRWFGDPAAIHYLDAGGSGSCGSSPAAARSASALAASASVISAARSTLAASMSAAPAPLSAAATDGPATCARWARRMAAARSGCARAFEACRR